MTLEMKLRDARDERYDEGLEQGLSQGRLDEKNDTALNMLRKQLPDNLVSECTGLSLKEVEKLRKLL